MTCDYCAKCRQVRNRRSKSNIKTKKIQHANVQRLRASVGGSTQRVYACTRCIRSGLVLKVG